MDTQLRDIEDIHENAEVSGIFKDFLTNTWVTDIQITKENVVWIVREGRSR